MSEAIRPLHPVYAEFWKSEEKRLLAEVQRGKAGSIQQWVANTFYLTAAANVRSLQERDTAIAMTPWEFYRSRGNRIAVQFNHRLSSQNVER